MSQNKNNIDHIKVSEGGGKIEVWRNSKFITDFNYNSDEMRTESERKSVLESIVKKAIEVGRQLERNN